MSSIARKSTITTATKSIIEKSVNYQILESDYCVIATSSGITITLPNPTTIAGYEFVIKNRSDDFINISPFAGEEIEGETGEFILYADESINVITDGTDWFII